MRKRSGSGHGTYPLPMLSCLLYVRENSPCIGPLVLTTHAPQLDQTVVSGGNDQWEARVEGNPVDPPIMTLENKFHHRICVSKHIGLAGIGAGHLVFEGDRSWRRVLLSEPGNIPDADRLIQGGRNNQIVFGVELCTHHIVIVTGHGADWVELSAAVFQGERNTTYSTTCSANSIF